MYDDTAFSREFADVLPGDAWQPETAERYNAVNALLRASDGAAQELPLHRTTPAGHLTGINNSDTAISAGCAVVPVTPLVSSSGFSDDPSAAVTLSSAQTTGIWGITLEVIPPHGFGTVLLAGITAAEQISGTPAQFVTAGANGTLQYAASGRAEVLKSDSSGKALLCLGGGGSSSSEYNGMFKIIRGTTSLFKVVDGADPDSGIAGYTDFGTVNSAGIDQTGDIWLLCRFTGTAGEPMTNATCQMSIVAGNPTDTCGKVRIGTTSALTGGGYKIVQYWRNNAVYWRTWYML